MRMSCNGCRVLRKGCSEDCSIKPCLRWLKTPDSQSHATLFLAKFYGRAGLINLINATPENLRQEGFRSLLYDACGRIVNPAYGSVGLLGTGRWDLCEAAVHAVLSGEPIKTISSPSSDSSSANRKGCDIRHVSKGEGLGARDHHQQLHKVVKSSKTKFKRLASKEKPKAEPSFEFMSELAVSCEQPSSSGEADDVSVETVEASLAVVDEATASVDGIELDLELTL